MRRGILRGSGSSGAAMARIGMEPVHHQRQGIFCSRYGVALKALKALKVRELVALAPEQR